MFWFTCGTILTVTSIKSGVICVSFQHRMSKVKKTLKMPFYDEKNHLTVLQLKFSQIKEKKKHTILLH